MHGLIALILLLGTPSYELIGPDLLHLASFEPFVHGSEASMEALPDGTVVYHWPEMSDAYLRYHSIDEIDRWMDGQCMRASSECLQYRHDVVEGCGSPAGFCGCLNVFVGPHPVVSHLTHAQWGALSVRVIEESRRSEDVKPVKRLFGRLTAHGANLRSARCPDLTPLLLAMIDAAALGDSSCLVELSRAQRKESFRGRYDREAVMEHILAHSRELTDPEAALAMMMLVHALDLEEEVPERVLLGRLMAEPHE